MVLILADKRMRLIIEAIDNASSVFKSVRTNASGMASHLTKSLDNSIKFEKSLKQYNNAMYGFNRVVSNIARTAGDSIYNFTKEAINNFSELERQHAKTMGAMATDYAKTAEAQAKFLNDSEKLKQQAIQIGSYGVNGKGALNTVTDVSYAQTALIKSGLSADDILDTDVVESILKFSGGNDLDVDTATTFAVNLGTVFDKPIEEWGAMLDMITKAADISVIDVQDIMDSLTYTGGIASGLGRDLEEVLGVISVMGQAGLRGRVAGTGLQAFFTRILSAGELSDEVAGSAPTDYVAQMYDSFTAEAVNADGSFKDMDEVASLLDIAMESLNDQEQAWFAKKLFGLYQMKAAYALTGAVDGDINLITDFINQITNQSAGVNDIKYELMQGSQYGKITSLKNAWEGIKTDFGDKLSPVISTVADELLTFLSNNGNYEIDWNALRDAFDESGDLIGAKYGEEIGKAIENIGNLGIDAGMIADAMLPYVGGMVNAFTLLMQGDIGGALEAFLGGLEDTNNEIEDLPPELQGSAEAARNVIRVFTTLAGINLATSIIQPFLTAFNTLIGKPIKAITAKISSTKTDVATTTSTVTIGTATTVTIGTATAVNIGQVPLMNVTASVVNVFGGGGSPTNPTNPTTPTLPSGPSTPLLPMPTPTLPGGGGTLLLPGAAANAGANLLEGAPTANKFPWFGADSAVLNPDGSVATRLWKIGGKSYNASQILGSVGRILGIAGVLGQTLTLTGDSTSPEYVYNEALTKGTEQGYDNEDLRQYLSIYFQDRNMNDEWAVKTYDAQTEMYKSWLTKEGSESVLGMIKVELNNNDKLSEDFLRQLVTYTGSTGGTYVGSQNDIEALLEILFKGEYERPWLFAGSYADQSVTDFVKDAFKGNFVYDTTGLPSILDVYPFIGGTLVDPPTVGTPGIPSLPGSSPIVAMSSVTDMMDRIQSPNITVNVTTNVDKNGNAVSDVNINNLSKAVARRSTQYGQQAMIN
jgi:TP901 family phage tail tape measure protein